MLFHGIVLFCVYTGIEALTITSFVATGNAILGPSTLQMTCSYIPASGTVNDTVFYISLQAKRGNPKEFKNVATFYPPNLNTAATFTTDGEYLKNKATLTNPTSSAADVETHAVMTFSEIDCVDETEYKCIVSYTGPVGPKIPERLTNITVKGKPAEPDNAPRWTPESGIEEGTDVTVTCTGNVGKPPGKFKWTKYRGSIPTDYPGATTTAVEMPGTCTSNGTSSLRIRLTAEDNNAVIKCAVDQELATTDMYKQSQPDDLVVYYQVKNIQITKSPNLPQYVERESDITLTCSADGHPPPTYTWYKDTDVTTILASGNWLIIQKNDVTVCNNPGNYVCVARNNFNGQNHNRTRMEHIRIVYKPEVTTATITDTTKPRQDDSSDNSGLVGGIIFLCVFQIGELCIVFIFYRKGMVVFRLQKEKVYEDTTNNRPDDRVYSTMNRASEDNTQIDESYHNM